jgi:predicted ferric reductase
LARYLAGFGETAIYLLVALSLLRFVPYRWWRLTHRLLGIPFLFACFHFFTATKPYANGSPWGMWFGLFIVGGAAAFFWRVVVLDLFRRGARYTVVSSRRVGNNTELRLKPSTRRRIRHRVGQFAVLRVQRRGLAEPHPFTIASHPDHEELLFIIRDLGDWTDRVGALDLTGETVEVEGPFGRFEPFGEADQTHVWIAGGVGVTPLLSALPTSSHPNRVAPYVFYAVRSLADAPGLDALVQADAGGHIRLQVFDSSAGQRMTESAVCDVLGATGLAGAHVALCGPAGLVRAFRQSSADGGAGSIEVEDFDFRQGFGPELSREVQDLVDRARSATVG